MRLNMIKKTRTSRFKAKQQRSIEVMQRRNRSESIWVKLFQSDDALNLKTCLTNSLKTIGTITEKVAECVWVNMMIWTELKADLCIKD